MLHDDLYNSSSVAAVVFMTKSDLAELGAKVNMQEFFSVICLLYHVYNV